MNDPVPPPPPVWQTHLGGNAQLSDLYHEILRTDLLPLLREPYLRMLDVGCAGGAFGGMLKERDPRIHVTGIETHPGAAERARTRLDHVIAAPLEEIDFAQEGIAPGSLDVIILADVLEHLYDPWRALLRLRPLLAANGYLVVSIPNARNFGIISLLADRGRFPYTNAGLLDITHIRFFTVRELHSMLEETGFRVEMGTYNLDGRFEAAYERNKGRSDVTMQMGRVTLSGLSEHDVLELSVWQWLVRAVPS